MTSLLPVRPPDKSDPEFDAFQALTRPRPLVSTKPPAREMAPLAPDSFPPFDTIKVSTKTIIVVTNLVLNITELFNRLPVTSYLPTPKKRGRKKKIEDELDAPLNLTPGSIVTLILKDQIRGCSLKKKKKPKTELNRSDNYFLNSVTVVMFLAEKMINFKISANGKFQIVGCKSWAHARECLFYMWRYIRDQVPDAYSLKGLDDQLKCLFIPAMRNVVFSLGFNVDRENLNKLINGFTEYTSMLESNFGHTGVNIKIPLTRRLTDIERLHYLEIPILDPKPDPGSVSEGLRQLSLRGDPSRDGGPSRDGAEKKERARGPGGSVSEGELHPIYGSPQSKWLDVRYLTYEEYIQTLSLKDKTKLLAKKRYLTFLVFQSGKCIMSALHKLFMKGVYENFKRFVLQNRELIEERLEED